MNIGLDIADTSRCADVALHLVQDACFEANILNGFNLIMPGWNKSTNQPENMV